MPFYLITDSGDNAFLFERRHHLIIYAKLNFKVHFTLLYDEHLVWDYSKAKGNYARKSFVQVNKKKVTFMSITK